MHEINRLHEILDLIVCPACYGRLMIGSNEIRCAVCERRYEITDQIPVLITR